MTSIQTKTINGYGPYSYRVHSDGSGDQTWEYLGPAEEVDLNQQQIDEIDLTNDDNEQDQREIDLSTKSRHDLQCRGIANEVRDDLVDRFGEIVLSEDDDRRMTEIKLSEEAPRGAVSVVQGQAEDMENATETIGQEPLTETEKDKVDFSKRSVFWYRSAKADILNEGVDNWTDYVDHQREDPHSHSDNLSLQDRSGGERMDEDRRGTDTTSQLETMDKNETRAVRAVAEEDDPGAREFLRTKAGYDPSEIDAAASEVVAV